MNLIVAVDENWGGMTPFIEQGLGIDSARQEAFRLAAIA